MNDNKRNALNALEALKRSTLLVLYDAHVNGHGPLSLVEGRERLGIPTLKWTRRNHFIGEILNYLADDGYAKYTLRNQWQITQEGVT